MTRALWVCWINQWIECYNNGMRWAGWGGTGRNGMGWVAVAHTVVRDLPTHRGGSVLLLSQPDTWLHRLGVPWLSADRASQ